MTNTEFLEFIGNLARNDMVQTGVLASLTIAQAILESGWGKSDLATTGNNLFGMKASSSWTGQVYNATTKECYDGVNLVATTANFKAYVSWEDSIADHSALFTGASRYAKVVGESDYKTACVEVKNAGYATDPNYPSKLIALIEQHKLYEYDLPTTTTATTQSGGDAVMGNSSLISGTILSPNKSTRTKSISKIAIHITAGTGTAVAYGNMFANSESGVSSHYGIDSQGTIYLYVNESDRAWCTGGGTKVLNGKKGSDIDHEAVTIEVANTVAAEPWPVSDTAYAKLLDLVEDIARRNGFSEVTYKADGTGTLQAHRWYSAKACPGDYLMERFPSIADEVTKRIKGQATTTASTTATATATVPTSSASDVPYTVRVTDDSLNIREGAGATFAVTGCITDCGVYTIVDKSGNWGRLKSGAGWIHLGFTERV